MSAIVPDFGDAPVCVCGDDQDDHVFTAGGFCNLCECERYAEFGTARSVPPASPVMSADLGRDS